MDLLVTISIILILIAIALYLPPLFLLFLIICVPKYGILPVIIYLCGIALIYKIKRRGKSVK